MSREDIVAIASRLFAIFILVTALRSVGVTFEVAYQSTTPSQASAYALLAIIFVSALAASFVLWFFPLTIARKLLPVMKEPQPSVTWQSSNAMELALAILGFWILTSAFSDCVYWITYYYKIRQETGTGLESISAAGQAEMVVAAVELVIGLWLVLGQRGIAKLFNRLRFGGHA